MSRWALVCLCMLPIVFLALAVCLCYTRNPCLIEQPHTKANTLQNDPVKVMTTLSSGPKPEYNPEMPMLTLRFPYMDTCFLLCSFIVLLGSCVLLLSIDL